MFAKTWQPIRLECASEILKQKIVEKYPHPRNKEGRMLRLPPEIAAKVRRERFSIDGVAASRGFREAHPAFVDNLCATLPDAAAKAAYRGVFLAALSTATETADNYFWSRKRYGCPVIRADYKEAPKPAVEPKVEVVQKVVPDYDF